MENNYSVFKKISSQQEYSGKWVIILNNTVVANGSAEKIKEIMKAIRNDHPNKIPLIAKIPKKIMQIV